MVLLRNTNKRVTSSSSPKSYTRKASNILFGISLKPATQRCPDGVGGTLEMSAVKLVRLVEDIPNAEAMFQKLKGLDSSAKLFFVEENEVEKKVEEMLEAPPLVAVKGTTKMHQVYGT